MPISRIGLFTDTSDSGSVGDKAVAAALDGRDALVAQPLPIADGMLLRPGTEQALILFAQAQPVRLGHIKLDSGNFAANLGTRLYLTRFKVDRSLALAIHTDGTHRPLAKAVV